MKKFIVLVLCFACLMGIPFSSPAQAAIEEERTNVNECEVEANEERIDLFCHDCKMMSIYEICLEEKREVSSQHSGYHNNNTCYMTIVTGVVAEWCANCKKTRNEEKGHWCYETHTTCSTRINWCFLPGKYW